MDDDIIDHHLDDDTHSHEDEAHQAVQRMDVSDGYL
jgi:hypothetical protein